VRINFELELELQLGQQTWTHGIL